MINVKIYSTLTCQRDGVKRMRGVAGVRGRDVEDEVRVEFVFEVLCGRDFARHLINGEAGGRRRYGHAVEDRVQIQIITCHSEQRGLIQRRHGVMSPRRYKESSSIRSTCVHVSMDALTSMRGRYLEDW